MELTPTTGPTADLARAAAIAVWAATHYPTHGPWASSKPPPRGSREYLELQEIALAKREARWRSRQWWDPDPWH